MLKKLPVAPKILKNDFKGYNYFAMLSSCMFSINENVTIDLSHVERIDHNLQAILGCIMISHAKQNYSDKLVVNKNILRQMSMTGFKKAFRWQENMLISDKAKNDFQYMTFNINEHRLFSNYVENDVLQHPQMPKLSLKLKKHFQNSILELFINAKEHAGCTEVFACGHYFPHRKMIFFTVVDMGVTIKKKVVSYWQEKGIKSELSPITWATKKGNSTKGTTGGLGFYLIEEFVRLNEGKIFILS